MAINNLLSFLKFDDWFARNRTTKDWIVVANCQKEKSKDSETKLFTFSALVSNSGECVKKLLTRADWEVESDFALPEFYTTSEDPNPRYDAHSEVSVNGMEFRPFVFWRYFHGYTPAAFELLQSFVLYHEAFWDREAKEYRRLDAAGDLHVVARLTEKGDEQIEWQIDSHHLKDYLAATSCYLVRYHGHMRWVGRDITADIGGKSKTIPQKEHMRRFELSLRTDCPTQNYKSVAWLRGKDIIEPYPRPDERHIRSLTNSESPNDSVNFIVGRQADGKDVFLAPDGGEYLMPIFFKRQVLDKYYAEPKKFQVTEWSQVACLDLWGLPIDRSDEDLIQAWLGDLGRILYKEQLHWRESNVAPKGGITERRFRQDFCAEFVDVTGQSVHDFKSVFEHEQTVSQRHYGDSLFLALSEKDRGLYEALHVPTSDEPKAFDDQVHGLAKMTVDSLNVELLKRLAGTQIDNDRIKGSISLLEAWLRLSLAAEQFTPIIRPFRTLQGIRSASAAHRKGSELEAILNKTGLTALTNPKKFEKLLVDLTLALEALVLNFPAK